MTIMILSVNGGRAKAMAVQADTVMTGFDKRPLPGRVRVEADGLASDEYVADAGDLDRAVLLYQRCHYDAWEAELERSLAPGTFGENLTIEWPADEGVRLGDELRAGGVRLRVTQPRIPCRKMAVRLGESADFPGRYLLSGRLGFFCQVLEPGELQAGDAIEVLRRGEVSIAEMARIVHRERDVAGMKQLLGTPLLPASWRDEVERRLRRATDADGAWPGERELVVSERREETPEVAAFDLCDPDGARLPDFAPGQFLTLQLDVPDRDRPLARTYTLVGRSAGGDGYRIAVKREPAPADAPQVPPGVASGHLHAAVAAGSALRARAPRGRFVVEPGPRPVALVSAGIGITPMVAMLERLAADSTGRSVHFVHGARSSREHAFGGRVRRLLAADSALHGHVLYSRPQPDDVLGRDFDERGRITAEVLERVLPSLDADFYVCGPGDFMRDVVRGLVDRGVPADDIRFELFGAASPLLDGPEALDAEGRPIVVTFARSGTAVPWREGAFSLLALAEQAGVPTDASCRTGVCGTCTCRIDDGDVEYVVDPAEPPGRGEVMVCCARPRTSVMLDL